MTEIVIRMLKEIRSEMGAIRSRMDERFDTVDRRMHAMEEQLESRFEVVESTLLTLATQNRFIVRHLTSQSRQLRNVESRLERVEKPHDDEKP